MNNLLNTRCYTCGPVENYNDNWRIKITPELKKFGIRVLDPLIKPNWMYNVTGLDQKNDRIYINKNFDDIDDLYMDNVNKLLEIYVKNNEIKNVCLRLISMCDFVICKIGGPTVGTFHELAIANDQNKPILFFTDSEDRLDSMWRLVQFTRSLDEVKNTFFKSMDDVIEYLTKIDSGKIKVNPIKWIFLNGMWPS